MLQKNKHRLTYFGYSTIIGTIHSEHAGGIDADMF